MDQFANAIHRTVLDYGAKNLADQMGMGYQQIINKANPNEEAHKFNVMEFRSVLLNTGDRRALDVLTHELEAQAGNPRKDVMHAVLDAGVEHGDVGRVVRDAMADGRISSRDLSEIVREVTEAKEALDQIVAAAIEANKGSTPRIVND